VPAASAQTKQDKEAESKPVAYTSVQRPLTLPPGGHLALSLGLFASADGAAERKQQLSNLGYETRLIAVRDENSATWYLLAAGSYDSDAAAESARATLVQQMNHGAPIGVVLLPPPPSASAPGAP
jgi:cell division protein FtsN